MILAEPGETAQWVLVYLYINDGYYKCIAAQIELPDMLERKLLLILKSKNTSRMFLQYSMIFEDYMLDVLCWMCSILAWFISAIH